MEGVQPEQKSRLVDQSHLCLPRNHLSPVDRFGCIIRIYPSQWWRRFPRKPLVENAREGFVWNRRELHLWVREIFHRLDSRNFHCD
jgi:hypothetical protein